MRGLLAGVLTGALVGAALAMLLAPSGDELPAVSNGDAPSAQFTPT